MIPPHHLDAGGSLAGRPARHGYRPRLQARHGYRQRLQAEPGFRRMIEAGGPLVPSG